MIDIKPSQRNTNKHTKDGMDLLENSINKVGIDITKIEAKKIIFEGYETYKFKYLIS